MSVIVVVDIPAEQFDAAGKGTERNIERALVRAMGAILKRIGLAQVRIYTQTGRPAKPPGSKYQRTFGLQRSDEAQILSNALPELRGEWRVNEGAYPAARYVVGARGDQAPIHRGRWKSLEEVRQEIDVAAPDIVNNELLKIL